jgi:hypothetical protein
MKAETRAEKIRQEMETAKAKRDAYQRERQELADRRVKLQNERAALAGDGDADAKKRRATLRQELAAAVVEEEDAAEVVGCWEVKVAALHIALAEAERAALRDQRQAEIDAATAEAAEISDAWEKFAALAVSHKQRLDRIRRLDHQIDGKARDLDLRFLSRAVAGNMNDIRARGEIVRRVGERGYGELFPALLKRGNLPMTADEEAA